MKSNKFFFSLAIFLFNGLVISAAIPVSHSGRDGQSRVLADPVSVWTTFLGSTGSDFGNGIIKDNSGNVFVIGTAAATWGSPARAYNGGTDAFVAKLDSNGALVWNTFLGSGSNDYGYGVALDNNGNIYVTGSSAATWGSPVRAYQGDSDSFVAKLNSSGVLLWNTFLGGTGSDNGLGIAVTGAGDAYVTGDSSVTWGSPVDSFSGGSEAFVARLNTSGALQWNTFLGGIGDDYGYGIAVDGAGKIFVTGKSNATWGSPVTAYYYSFDVFVAKLDSSANLLWNTFNDRFGYSDQGKAIAVDSSGYIYVVGSDSYYHISAVVQKFDSTGGFLARTLLGNQLNEVYARGIAIDAHDNIYVTGQINYAWADWSVDPLNPYAGGTDAFVAKLCPNLSLKWYTFLGSSGIDNSPGIAVDGSGNVSVIGSSDATWGSPVNPHGGSDDAFIARISDSQTTSLTLTAPNGGENWIAGTTQNITWATTGTIDSVKIEYSTNNGGTWTAAAYYAPNTGSYAWVVPNNPSTQGRVRISDAGDSCTGDISNSVFVLAPAITVTAPNGGESWSLGSTQLITWTSAGTITDVKIDYSTNNGTDWSSVTPSTPNDGSFSWLTPNSPSFQCLVRVSNAVDEDFYDVSDSVFTLTQPTISVISPNGGEIWPTGSTQKIVWTWTGSITAVKIEYSLNNGGTWSLIDASTLNDGLFSWVIPAISSTQSLIRITDALDGTVSDSSDSVFTFTTSPTLVVNSPNGGEIWVAGSAAVIRWSSFGSGVPNVKLEYTTNNGVTWKTIVPSTANDEIAGWTVPSVNSTQCKVRVSDAVDGLPSDASNNVFTIRKPGAAVGGHWTGSTNRNEPVSFDVFVDGGQWSNFELSAPVSSGIGTIVNVVGPGSIINNGFTARNTSGTFTATGVFTSDSEASGTYEFVDYYLGPYGDFTQSGTWSTTAPPLTLISPNGGEAWEPGMAQNITWASLSTVGNLKIEYSADNGTSWQTIIASTPNDGVYEWSVPVIRSTEGLVRVSEAADGAPFDVSDGVFSIMPAVNLGGAVDNTSLKWFSGGGAPWFGENSTFYYDGDAAQSGAIDYSQESYLQTAVTGPGTISFYWKVSSYEYVNYFHFYIDGASQDQISGEVDWAQKTYSIPAGSHTLKWVYQKYSSTVSGSDCGWVDKVEFIPDLTVSGTVTCGSSPLPGVVMSGFPTTPATDASGVYVASVNPGWSGTATPSLAGYTFNPANRVFTNVTVAQTGQDFAATALPPTITLTSPNGWENWASGTIHNIAWTTTGTVANVKLEYSTNNGTNWTTIIASTANANFYAWTLPAVVSPNCLVRVSEASTGIPSDVSNTVFSIAPPGLAISSPNGGESWVAGSNHNITWTTTTGSVSSVKLEYSTNNGTNWTTIIASTSNLGGYAWTLPAVVSANCLVRVSEATTGVLTDVSDGVFAIIPAAGFSVTSPNGGESWEGGSVHNITWTTTGTIANVKIEYSTNSGTNWTTIIATTVNVNSYTWTLPDIVSANCLIKVSEASGGTPNDVSNAVFAIIAGTPSIGLSKTSFNFGTERNGTPTPAEYAVISNTGGGTLNWTAAPSAAWLGVSPGSGTGAGSLMISVVNTNLTPGTYSGTITVSAPNAANSPRTITVNLNVKAAGSDSPPFGNFATPNNGSTVASSVPVTGWVLDDIGMKSLKIYRGTNTTDRIYIGDAIFVEGARPDVKNAYPTYPQNTKAGWGYMLLTNFLPNGGNGTFTLLAYAKDTGDHEVLLGSKTITCDNAHAVKPFGAIDTPSQGGTASGDRFVNFGWALTPQPNSINSNGSTIWVYVDGVALAHPVYNNYRKDIATLFPGYANSGGAIGYYYLNTIGYSDGVHTIAWSVTDSGGNTDGIGSRYFAIQNVGGGSSANEAAESEAADSLRFTGVRSTAEIASIPEDGRMPVYVKRGFGVDRGVELVFPETDGSIRISIPEVSRVAVYLNEQDAGETAGEAAGRGRRIINKSASIDARYMAYELVGGELLPLPIGASFDSNNGILYWQPGPGFLGDYHFVVIDSRSNTKKTITITLTSK